MVHYVCNFRFQKSRYQLETAGKKNCNCNKKDNADVGKQLILNCAQARLPDGLIWEENQQPGQNRNDKSKAVSNLSPLRDALN